MAENTHKILGAVDTGLDTNTNTSPIDPNSLEWWKYRVATIPPGTGETDVLLGGKNYTLYRPDAKKIWATLFWEELQQYDTIEAFYRAVHPDNQVLETKTEGDVAPEFREYRDLILTIPRGQGKAGIIIRGKSYTIQRKSIGEEIDVIIDGKFVNFSSISDFLESLGVKKQADTWGNTPDIDWVKIPKELLYPKRGDIIEYDGKSYRYIGMGERWQVQDTNADWNKLDYITWPFITNSELKNKIIEATKESVKEKVKKLSTDTRSDNEKLIEAFEKQIWMANNLIETGIDNLGKEISYVDKLGIEGTIRKMQEQIKRLKKEIEKESSQWKGETSESKKDYPVGFPVTKGEVVPFDPNRWREWIRPPVPETPQKGEWEKPEIEKPEIKKPEVPTPESPDVSFLPKVRSIRSNISDVKENLEDIALSRSEERLRLEYAKSGFFGKAKNFFTRAKKLEQYRQEELATLRAESLFDATTNHIRSNASDRFAKSNALTGTENIKTNSTLEMSELDTLATSYVQGGITRIQFEEDFDELVKNNTVLQEALKGIEHKGTNIVKHLDRERALLLFLRDLPDDILAVEAHLELILRSDPSLKKSIENALSLTFEERKEQIVFLLAKREVRETLRDQNIKVSLDILTWGEAAFAIVTGEKTDTRAYKVGKWLQKHPVLSSVGTALGITASSLAGGPIGNLISGTLGIGSINGLRRNAEYTDEHTGFEKRITQGAHLESDIYVKVEELRSELAKATGLKKRWLAFRLDRAEAKLALYQTQGISAKKLENGKEIEGRVWTTHRHFAPIGSLNRKLYAYITEKQWFELTGEKAEKNKEYLRLWILQGLARIDLWKKSGHNYLKSKKEDDMEGDYNILYENLLGAWEKLWISFEELRKSKEYEGILGALDADYARAEKSFEWTRTSTSVKKWVVHGAIYGGTSMVFQWLAGTGLFDSTNIVPGKPTFTAGGVVVDPGIAADLQRVLWQSQYDAFVNHLSASTTPETLWDTLVTDIFSNKSVGNDMKNQIMTFILNATDIQNGVTKPELLIEAAKQGIFTDIANNSSNIDHVLDLMKKWGYGSVNKTWLIDTLRSIDAGTLQTWNLNPLEQTKVAEVLWCYVHRDGVSASSPMWQVFMDKLPDVHGKLLDTTVIEKGGDWLQYIGIPTWKNTFLSRLHTDLVDDTGKPITPPKDQWTWIDNSWKEDVIDQDKKKRWQDKKDQKWPEGKEEKLNVVTRGDKKEIDARDVNPDYPEAIIEKSEEEVINYTIDKAPAKFGDDQKYIAMWKAWKITRTALSELIRGSLSHQKTELKQFLPAYEGALESAYKQVQGIFEKYNLNHGRIMSYDAFRKNTHFYTFYEFMTNLEIRNSSDALSVKGFNRLTTGEIAFNTFGLTSKPLEEQIRYIKHVAIHELLHGTAVNNYWEDASSQKSDFMHRRAGMVQVNGKLKERGRSLNEGIVESLAYKAMCSLFGNDYAKEGNKFYREERRVIALLSSTFGIDESLFVRAAYDRDGMKALARALEGKNGERKWFLTLILSLMDRSVTDTINFLNGGKFYLMPTQYSKVLHPSLQKDGGLAPKILEYIVADYSGISLRNIDTKNQITE